MAETLKHILNNLNRAAQIGDIAGVITSCQQALSLGANNLAPELRAGLQLLLGNSLINSPYGEQIQNIELAIEAYEQALSVLKVESELKDWVSAKRALATAYFSRTLGNRADNIEKAIFLYREVLQVLSVRALPPFERASILANLGNAYQERIHGDKADNIENGISLYQEALQVITRENAPHNWARIMINLGTAYRDRIKGNKPDNVETAITTLTQVQQVLTRETKPVDWAKSMINLGEAYRLRIKDERASNIELAILANQQALEVISPENAILEWGTGMMNLANAYQERIQGNQGENIDRAIKVYVELLHILTPQLMPYLWGQAKMNLAIAYYWRILGNKAENLEQAIYHCQEALKVRTRENMPIEWSETILNFGVFYQERIRGDKIENIERAIELYQQALEVRTRQAMPLDWATAMMNLANAYFKRLEGEKQENIERAIESYQQVLEVRTSQLIPLEWAKTTMNLANAYFWRIKGSQIENIEKSIAYNQQALQVMTQEAFPVQWAKIINNLAIAYSKRIQGEKKTNLELAAQHYKQALNVHTLDKFPADHLILQRNLGHLYFSISRWKDAYSAYASAINASQFLYQVSITSEGKQSEIEKMADIFGNATYCLVHLGQLEKAVTLIEASKTRILNEALSQREVRLKDAQSIDRDAFEKAHQRLLELESEARAIELVQTRDFVNILTDLGQARRELFAIVDRIRSYVPDFMPEGLDFPDLAKVATNLNQPIVYILTTIHGSLALIVQPLRKKVAAIWCNDFQTDELDNILYDQDDTVRYLHRTLLANSSASIQAFKRLLNEIWPILDKLMAPIAVHLGELGYQQALLIPTGTLTLLPLHAICYDSVTFALAPSARALQSAQRTAQQHSSPRLLGIGNPLANNQKPLAFARLEVEEISPLFAAARTFYEDAATRKAVKGSPATHLHFACHGAFDMQQPLNSALYLADSETLTLRDMLDGNLDLSSARLAVLSACQTGITDFLNVPDEAIGFPAGFMQAGVPGVISTLWRVADISTALLLVRFYRYHLQDGMEPAIALHKAQKWLREATVKEMRLTEYYKQLYQRSRRREEKARALQAMRHYQVQPDLKPFEHPYYWAAFVFSGV